MLWNHSLLHWFFVANTTKTSTKTLSFGILYHSIDNSPALVHSPKSKESNKHQTPTGIGDVRQPFVFNAL